MKFYIKDANGNVARYGDATDPYIQPINVGETLVVGSDPPLPPPTAPTPPTLSQMKVAKWADIRAAQRRAETGGFTAGAFTWDSDLATQQRMQLTWQDMKEADGPSTVTWYTADGVSKTLTAVQFKALARALRAHLAAQQDHASTLRAQIVAATTVAEVDAITW